MISSAVVNLEVLNGGMGLGSFQMISGEAWPRLQQG
jgi:hypothetical protein